MSNGRGAVELTAYLVPHPPLIVPGVGAGDEIPDTRAAYERVAAEAAALQPETIVIYSPHRILYGDYFHLSPGAAARGDIGQFRAPQVHFEVQYDQELAAAIVDAAEALDLPAGFLGERDPELDHGTMAPLYFLHPALPEAKIVRMSLSGLSLIDHYRLGMCVAEAIRQTGRRTLVIASGDMSHKLKADGPYGLAPEGAQHDAYVRSCLEDADIRRLLRIDPHVRSAAAECGFRSIVMAAGALDGLALDGQVYSYEGPYGVGYMVARLHGQGSAPSLLPLLEADVVEQMQATRAAEDPYVSLARHNVESCVREGRMVEIPADAPQEMLEERAGVFVSIHKQGSLRGCIGTITPVYENIAQEILHNSVSAAVRDPRFNPIEEDELESLDYSVDVLGPTEDIDGPEQLDVKRYGVVVSCEGRRGLLLPNLDGVDEVAEQIDIARQKGGISSDEPYTLQRFEVVRHY
jgi:AmmeMemoRadiSam system protein A/AmmeMemoRadiSam system protein B